MLCAPNVGRAGTACDDHNVANGASMVKPSTPRAHVAIDGVFASEGAIWNGRAAVVMPVASLAFDLHGVFSIRYLAVQADNDDAYRIEGSVDGHEFSTLWTAGPRGGSGLRVRERMLDRVAEVRFLKVVASGGDGRYSISEIYASCRPPTTSSRVSDPARPILTQGRVDVIKAVVAVLGLLLLTWGLALRRAGRADLDARARDGMLLALGIVAAVAWWNLFQFHFAGGYVHKWDVYHHYVGSKYARELGYTHLYECAVVADREAAVRGTPARTFRDLESNELVPVEIADAHRCHARFTAAHWKEFEHDVAYFRDRMGTARWEEAQRDHGFNASPAWTLLGGMLARAAPASDTQIWILATLDPLLLVAAFGFIISAFGWRAACVALLFWGTNYPARYWWTGGSFLRADWFALAIASVCFAKRQRFAASGFALAWAGLLRLFPLLLLSGLIARWSMRCWRARRLDVLPAERRFTLGFVAALALLVPLSSAVAGGPRSWGEFAANTAKHADTPLTNHVGLKTVIGYEQATRAEAMRNIASADPFERWKDARRQAHRRRWPLYAVLVIGFAYLLARAVEDREEWVVLALGCGSVVIVVELTCYYWSILAIMGLLWTKCPQVGVALLAFSAATCALPVCWDWYDQVFAAISLIGVAFVLFATRAFDATAVTRHSRTSDASRPQARANS